MSKTSRQTQRGVGLFDGLVALAILAFGLLALTGFQSRLVSQGTEAQQRMVASQLADELLNTALVDAASNTTCYLLPASGACTTAGATALAYTNAWKARVMSPTTLPNAAAPTVSIDASGRLVVTLQWTWTAKDGTTSPGTRTHTVTSDSR